MCLLFNTPATTEIYTLPYTTLFRSDVTGQLHDVHAGGAGGRQQDAAQDTHRVRGEGTRRLARSEEHTSELQSQFHLVCRLLLEKKKTRIPVAPLAVAPIVACGERAR